MYFPLKTIRAEILLPASKSISNRAIMLSALSYSPFDIENLSDSDDTKAMLNVLDSDDNIFDVGAAGTTMRFLTAFLAKTLGEWTITGSERMKQRPIKILVDALNQLGGRIEYLEKEGFPPLKIYGSALLGGELTLNGSVSSQYISALMMIAPYMRDGLKLSLTGKIASRPYIEMTKKMMLDFGVIADFNENIIDIRPQSYHPIKFYVESDWSAASYWYETLSIIGNGSVYLPGLRKDSYQGDSKVAKLFEQLGVSTNYLPDGIEIIANRNVVTHFEYDFTNEPDLAQTFVVTCCLKNIPFHFIGLESLKIKETNRVAALIAECKKIGYILSEPSDGALEWTGEICNTQEKITIDTYEDHRMAMAFAPCSLLQNIAINNPQVVSKSYPLFWNDFNFDF